MGNISITRRCRRHCGYCFAKHELARGSAMDMAPEVFDAALAFLGRSGIPETRMLGGEPTEHPRFCEYVARARERGFRVVVFSGGLVPQPALEYMAGLPADGFSVVLNAADPSVDSEALVGRQRELCQALGPRIMLGVNIRSPEQDPVYLLDWVAAFGTLRTIRVGLAHPIWGGGNEFFCLRGPRGIAVLESFFDAGAKRGVSIGFDCGFTPCMFSNDFVDTHSKIFTRSGANSSPAGLPGSTGQGRKEPERLLEAIGVRCNPVVDILPEGECIACYALSRFCRLPLPAGGTRDDLVSEFQRELSLALPMGVHRECLQCGYRARGMCGGGCRARRALRLRPDALIPLPREAAGRPGRPEESR